MRERRHSSIDSDQVYTMLRDIRQTQIEEIQVAAEYRGQVTEKLNGLCGPEGRVTKLEKYNERQEWKSYGKHALTAVLAVAMHKVTKLIGWNL